jgi:DNA-binding NtrC family response regulator
LKTAIGDWGIAVDTARSAEEAARMFQPNPYDIVLLDLNLPGKSGLEFLEDLRSAGAKCEAIILTGFGDLQTARKAIHLDIVDFLAKPAPLGDLEKAIDRAVRKIMDKRANDDPIIPIDEPAMPPMSHDGPVTLYEASREHILAMLKKHDGNRTATSAALGISLRTLHYRLSEYQKQGYAID